MNDEPTMSDIDTGYSPVTSDIRISDFKSQDDMTMKYRRTLNMRLCVDVCQFHKDGDCTIHVTLLRPDDVLDDISASIVKRGKHNQTNDNDYVSETAIMAADAMFDELDSNFGELFAQLFSEN